MEWNGRRPACHGAFAAADESGLHPVVLTSSVSSCREGCRSRVRAGPPGALMRGAGRPSFQRKTPPWTKQGDQAGRQEAVTMGVHEEAEGMPKTLPSLSSFGST